MANDPRLKHLRRPVESLKLSRHALKCLEAAGIKTVCELAAADEGQLTKAAGCGGKSIAEIRDALAQLSLTLGTVFDARGNIVSPDLSLIEKTRKLKWLAEKR